MSPFRHRFRVQPDGTYRCTVCGHTVELLEHAPVEGCPSSVIDVHSMPRGEPLVSARQFEQAAREFFRAPENQPATHEEV